MPRKYYNKKCLGKGKETILIPHQISVKYCQTGVLIKPCKQEAIAIPYKVAWALAHLIRHKRELFTYKEAEQMFMWETAKVINEEDRPCQTDSITRMREVIDGNISKVR